MEKLLKEIDGLLIRLEDFSKEDVTGDDVAKLRIKIRNAITKMKYTQPPKDSLSAEEQAEQYALSKFGDKIKTYSEGSSITAVYENCKQDFIAGMNASQFTAKEIEWISVKDRLPEENVNVLAVESGQVKIMALCYIADDDNNMGWFWGQCYDGLDGDAYVDDDYEVIYWTPLPEPPKKRLTEK